MIRGRQRAAEFPEWLAQIFRNPQQPVDRFAMTTGIYLPPIAEALSRVRQALTEKVPTTVRSDLRDVDHMLANILRVAGHEPGTTALHGDAVKLELMGQPRSHYAAQPLTEEVERLRARVAEVETQLRGVRQQ